MASMTTAVQNPASGPPRNPAPASPPPVVPHRQWRATDGAGDSRAHKILSYSLLVVGSLGFLVPFYFVLNASFKTDAAVQGNDFVSPAGTRGQPLRWQNYPRALSREK